MRVKTSAVRAAKLLLWLAVWSLVHDKCKSNFRELSAFQPSHDGRLILVSLVRNSGSNAADCWKQVFGVLDMQTFELRKLAEFQQPYFELPFFVGFTRDDRSVVFQGEEKKPDGSALQFILILNLSSLTQTKTYLPADSVLGNCRIGIQNEIYFFKNSPYWSHCILAMLDMTEGKSKELARFDKLKKTDHCRIELVESLDAGDSLIVQVGKHLYRCTDRESPGYIGDIAIDRGEDYDFTVSKNGKYMAFYTTYTEPHLPFDWMFGAEFLLGCRKRTSVYFETAFNRKRTGACTIPHGINYGCFSNEGSLFIARQGEKQVEWGELEYEIDGEARIFVLDPQGGKILYTLGTGQKQRLGAPDFLGESQRIAAYGTESSLYIWDLPNPHMKEVFVDWAKLFLKPPAVKEQLSVSSTLGSERE